MTELEPKPADGLSRWLDPGHDNAQLIYILYLLGLLTGITVIIGVILAYINRGKVMTYVETHYTWLIRTFWIGLLFSMVSLVLAVVLVGFLLMIATAVWAIVRIVIGLQRLSRREAIPDPESWWL